MTVNDNLYDGSGVAIEAILDYNKKGFILIPLQIDGKTPAVKSTNSIAANPWTTDVLKQNHYLFNNVATLLGKTHLKDNDDNLYLKVLDIEDKEVYDILASTTHPETGEYLLDYICETTFVVKTRKKWGLHIYWLDHEPGDRPIRKEDCKIGFQFELKIDNTTGHCTLPPSRHRDDETFRYQAIAENTIAIKDTWYGLFMSKLAICLKTKRTSIDSRTLTDKGVEKSVELLTDYYQKGSRQNLVLGLSGHILKCGLALDSGEKIVTNLALNDDERKDRIAALHATFKKDPNEVAGPSLLLEVLQVFVGRDEANKIVDKLTRIWSKYTDTEEQNVKQIVVEIIEQDTYKTIKGSEQLLVYNNTTGCYEPGERHMLQTLETLHPELTSYWRKEIVEHVKLRTGIDTSEVDADLNILNLENGLYNTKDDKLYPHTPDYVSVTKIPIKYKSRSSAVETALYQYMGMKPEQEEIKRPKKVSK
jgi:hypothetical protein